MWVMYMRMRLPHFRVYMNNHLESFFGHLKQSVKPPMGMADTIDALIKGDCARASEYNHKRLKIGRFYNHHYDDDMNQLLKFTNPFVAKSVEGEYKQTIDKENVFVFDEEVKQGVVVVHGNTRSHEFDLRTWVCTCSFSKSMKLPCQHTIAYQKRKQADCSISLKVVDERWLRPVQHLPGLSNPRVLFTPFSTKLKKRKLTKEAKYREAIRATEAICSELAGISDDDDFNEYLDFVLSQWRNVRQRKRVKSMACPPETRQDMEEPEAEDVFDEAPFVPSQISQPHSLYPEELGDVPMMKPVSLPVTGDLIVTSQTAPSQQEEDVNASDDNSEPDTKRKPKIALNPTAAKSGRPRLDRGQEAVDERESRLRFNGAQDARRTAGEVALQDLADALDYEKPPIAETARQLNGFDVRMTDNSNRNNAKKTPKYSVQKNPVLNTSAFYLLPQALLKKCFEVMPVANKKENAIEIHSQGEGTTAYGQRCSYASIQRMDAYEQRMETECVMIAGLCTYSRAQIEAMNASSIQPQRLP